MLARLDGVGDVRVFGARDYSMRIWLDPEKTAARNLTAGEVVAALQAQNVQVAAGVLNQPPVPQPGAFQLNIETLGRLADTRQFSNIVVKTARGWERYRPPNGLCLGGSAPVARPESPGVALAAYLRWAAQRVASNGRFHSSDGENDDPF